MPKRKRPAGPDPHDVPPWRTEPEWIAQIKRMEDSYRIEPPGPHRKWLHSAILSMRRGYERRFGKGQKVSPKPNPRYRLEYWAVVDYGEWARSRMGFRYSAQRLSGRPVQMPPSTQILVKGMSRRAARALADHLNKEMRHANPTFLRGGRPGAFFRERRPNPTLAVMGGNPPPGEDVVATWAQIEYNRPDDPKGKRIVRVHEFIDGFIATPMRDGSILLRHPEGKTLWTRR